MRVDELFVYLMRSLSRASSTALIPSSACTQSAAPIVVLQLQTAMKWTRIKQTMSSSKHALNPTQRIHIILRNNTEVLSTKHQHSHILSCTLTTAFC